MLAAVPATTPGPTPAQVQAEAADMAKVRAALQQLEAQKNHFDYAPSDESVVVPGPSAKLPAANDAAPDPVPSGPPLARGRRAGPGVALPIDGELKALGVDTGPVGVGVRDKSVVFSLKF